MVLTLRQIQSIGQKLSFFGLLCIPLLAFGIWGSTLGYSFDSTDSVLIRESAQSIIDGTYRRSRTSGFPLYEHIVATVLYFTDSIFAVNMFSVLFSLFSIYITHNRFRKITNDSTVGTLGLIIFCTIPIFLTNISSMMEYSLNAMLSVLYFYLFLSYIGSSLILRRFIIIGTVGVFLVLARIDSCILIIGCSISAVYATRNKIWAAHLIVVGAVSFLIYYYLNGNLRFVGLSDDFEFIARFGGTEPIVSRIAKSAVGWFSILWLNGFIAIWQFASKRNRLRKIESLSILVIFSLYIIRFILLPDELEYIAVPVILLSFVVLPYVSARTAYFMLILAVLSNAVTIGVFGRVANSDDIRIEFSLQEGGVTQDIRKRIQVSVQRRDDFRKWLSKQAGVDHLTFLTGVPGFKTPDNVLVISQQHLYRFNNARIPQAWYKFSGYNGVIVCRPAFRNNMGWRQLRIVEDYTVVDAFRLGKSINCQRIA